MLEKRQEADVRELNKALNDFRLMHQQPDGRREWDLYDPDAKRKDKPARVHDDDPRLTISGRPYPHDCYHKCMMKPKLVKVH